MERHEADMSARHTSAHHAESPEERKRRIDEALQAYDQHAKPTVAVHTAGHNDTQHPHEPAKHASPHTDPSEKSEKDFILEHAGEALAVLKHKDRPTAHAETVPTKTITPTDIDPDAPIPAAIAEINRERAEKEAAAKAAKFDVTQARFAEATANRKHVYLLIGAWLGAVPLAMLLGWLTSSLQPGFIGYLLTLVEYLLGLYGLLGWVPLMVLYMKRRTH